MIIIEDSLEFAGEIFTVTNQRTLFWEKQKALVLSDIHVGKSAHFRKNGIAMPQNVLQNDLKRLSSLIAHYNPEKILIVGDLLHAGSNSEVDFFCRWKENYNRTEFHLITGNHDRISRVVAEQLCLTSQEPVAEFGSLIFSHDCIPDHPKFQINGHIHPGIVLQNAVRKIRLPAFACTEKQLILPAFSEFTGLDIRNTPRKGKFWLCTKENLYHITK